MSTLTKLTDKGGNVYYTHCVDGEYFPPFEVETDYSVHLNNLKHLELRDDDVIIIGYAKSGTHWLWEVTGMLLAGCTDYSRNIKENQFFETKTKSFIDALPSPRILNTHLRFRYLPKATVPKKTKIVYLLRNPKDIGVSLYNHATGMSGEMWDYSTDWENFFESFIEGKIWNGSWFDSVLNWEKTFTDHPNLPVCTIIYEDMKQDPVSNNKRLSEYLGTSSSSEFCQEVADACSFHNLRHADEHLKDNNYLKDIWKSGSKGFYRKGEVGDWKNWFTAAQNEMFDAVYADRMKNSKLKFRFE